jgi:hypothetical protein
MISYRANGCGCEPKGSAPVGVAFELGQSLGGLFHTATRIVAGGIRMVRGGSERGGCNCRKGTSCDCIECLPPVYAGCCRNCGE